MESAKPTIDRPGIAIAAALLAIAAIILWDATSLPGAVYGIGPRAMPVLVACGLILLAIGNAVLAWRRDFPARETYDVRAVLLILGGIAVLIITIGVNGGFIPATTILFAATAAAFGRRALVTDFVIGFVLSTIVYLMFSKVLTLSLPMGPIERLF